MDENPSPPPDHTATRPTPERSRRRCSFCGMEDREHLVGGGDPSLAVCLDCVLLLVEIFKEEGCWPEE